MTNFNELYYRRPYDTEFEAEVVSCVFNQDRYEVILDQTLFYPEGGGQPCDHGELNGISVLDVQERDDKVIHYLDQPLPAGTKVKGKIDWERRFDFMQNHSGEHILSGLIHRHFGYENVGFHMGEVIQIDFDGMITPAQLKEIEMEANEVIYRNIEIGSIFPSAAELETMDYRSKKKLTGTVRIITVDNADCCACCGTHVSRTGEIGMIRILSCRKHKKGVRLEILSGKRAFEYTRMIMEQNTKISVALSAEPHKTYEALETLQKQYTDKIHQNTELLETLFAVKLQDYEENAPLLVDFEEGIERNSMRKMANEMLVKKNPRVCAVISSIPEGRAFVIMSADTDLAGYRNVLNEKLQGRGGGTKEILQGTFQASKEEIESVLKELFCTSD